MPDILPSQRQLYSDGRNFNGRNYNDDPTAYPSSSEEWAAGVAAYYGFTYLSSEPNQSFQQDVSPEAEDLFNPIPPLKEARALLDPFTSSPFDGDLFGENIYGGWYGDLCGHHKDFVGSVEDGFGDATGDSYYDVDYDENGDCDDDADGTGTAGKRKQRAANLYQYEFGDVFESNWYRKFLRPEIRDRTYTLSSRDRFGEFRGIFRVTLEKIDELVRLFLERGWIKQTRHCSDEERLKVKAQLLVMGALNVMAYHTPFRVLPSSTDISTSEHRSFFHLFIEKMYSIREEYVYYPRTPDELQTIMKRYEAKRLPGCGGSIDVVHLKWSNCPAGDRNRCVGKEGYPTLAFEVISGFDREILGVSSVQFGTRNDKHIVKLDKTVAKIRDDWYKTMEWEYYDANGNAHTAVGVYLICDGGYLRWPILICPYKGEKNGSQRGYFSTNLESVRKDVECVFGILKKRWKL